MGARSSAGDVLIALPSSGLHTNGYSLARRIAFDVLGLAVDSHVAELGETVGAALLRPHRSYLPQIGPLLDVGLDQGDGAHHRRRHHREPAADAARRASASRSIAQSWTVPPLFTWLQRAGGIDDAEMFRAFNMGVGLIVVTSPDHARRALVSRAASADAWPLGTVTLAAFTLGDGPVFHSFGRFGDRPRQAAPAVSAPR